MLGQPGWICCCPVGAVVLPSYCSLSCIFGLSFCRIFFVWTRYGGDAVDFRFATVMGAGHEVPTFKPIPAYAMLYRFESGLPL